MTNIENWLRWERRRFDLNLVALGNCCCYMFEWLFSLERSGPAFPLNSFDRKTLSESLFLPLVQVLYAFATIGLKELTNVLRLVAAASAEYLHSTSCFDIVKPRRITCFCHSRFKSSWSMVFCCSNSKDESKSRGRATPGRTLRCFIST